jgi:Vault protein inter-alpha-trypsin.
MLMNKKLVLAIGLFLLGGILSIPRRWFHCRRASDLRSAEPFPVRPARSHQSSVNVAIDGQVAITSIDQEFYNPNDQRLEGFYMFPVPKGAHIDKFSMEIGGKRRCGVASG